MAATFRSQERGHTEPGLQAGWHFRFCGKALRALPATMSQVVHDRAPPSILRRSGSDRKYVSDAYAVTLGESHFMDERSVTISPEYAAAVDQAGSSGDYGSRDEVVLDALREWKERRENHGYTIAELRRLVQEGIDSGPSAYASMEEIKAAARFRWNERKVG